MDFEDDGSQIQVRSIHYEFVEAHKLLMAYKLNKSLEAQTENYMERLGWDITVFFEGLTTDFRNKQNNISLIDVELSVEGAEGAMRKRGE